MGGNLEMGQAMLFRGDPVWICSAPHKALAGIGEYYLVSTDGRTANKTLGRHLMRPAPGVPPVDVARDIRFPHGDLAMMELLYEHPVALIDKEGRELRYENVMQAHLTIGTHIDTILRHCRIQGNKTLASGRYRHGESKFTWRWAEE